MTRTTEDVDPCAQRQSFITATVLWEITYRVLIWYYAVVPMVNVIYGSIALTVVALKSIGVVAFIPLLGTQVIEELERKSDKLKSEDHPEFAI